MNCGNSTGSDYSARPLGTKPSSPISQSSLLKWPTQVISLFKNSIMSTLWKAKPTEPIYAAWHGHTCVCLHILLMKSAWVMVLITGWGLIIKDQYGTVVMSTCKRDTICMLTLYIWWSFGKDITLKHVVEDLTFDLCFHRLGETILYYTLNFLKISIYVVACKK